VRVSKPFGKRREWRKKLQPWLECGE